MIKAVIILIILIALIVGGAIFMRTRIPERTSITQDTYWKDKAIKQDISVSDIDKIWLNNKEWMYEWQPTCVGGGGNNAPCDTDNFICSGIEERLGKFGWGAQQIASVKQAISTQNTVHSECPNPKPSTRKWWYFLEKIF